MDKLSIYGPAPFVLSMQIISFNVSSNNNQCTTLNIESNEKQTTAFKIYVHEVLLKNLNLRFLTWTDEVTLEL